jgi:hypothetical protein
MGGGFQVRGAVHCGRSSAVGEGDAHHQPENHRCCWWAVGSAAGHPHTLAIEPAIANQQTVLQTC